VYSYDAGPDVVAQVGELPVPALAAYAELIAFLELTPWEGAPYRDDKPDGNMRLMPFGERAGGIAVYVILEDPAQGSRGQRHVAGVIRLTTGRQPTRAIQPKTSSRPLTSSATAADYLLTTFVSMARSAEDRSARDCVAYPGSWVGNWRRPRSAGGAVLEPGPVCSRSAWPGRTAA
jgi:hypothetical protein